MTIFSIILAAIAPGIALLSYIYLKDRYESEPVLMVVRMFIFGALLVFPTMVLQRSIVLEAPHQNWIFTFIISAGIEEFVKWFLLIQLIYRSSYFDEPYDGIVYAVAISLGFATLENVIYALFDYSSFASLLFRAFLPVSGHALFAVFMGYQLGKAKFRPQQKNRYLLFSLLQPIAWHGVFDFILMQVHHYWLWLMAPLMILLWALSITKMQKANESSPFRTIHSDEEVKVRWNGQ